MSIRFLLLGIVALIAFFYPVGKSDASGMTNPIWVKCKKCSAQNNISGINGPWKCYRCDTKNDG